MFGPQSPVTFVLLIGVFAGLIVVLARSRTVVWKTFTGTMAFVPAMVFGIAGVNRYYDYYNSWSDAWDDLVDAPQSGVTSMADLKTLDRVLHDAATNREAPRLGLTLQVPLPGQTSGITRPGLIYLPPQYFRKTAATRLFPVVELLHGGPGTPSDYTRVMKIASVYLKLIASGLARPAVLVMPDSNGGRDVAEQCLDTVNGPKDETYLVNDVPADLVGRLRIQPQGRGWALAGYSEGGYCAANLGLRHSTAYGAVAVLSGYFAALHFSKLPQRVDPFAGNQRLRDANSPFSILRTLPPGAKPVLPPFWVMAGTDRINDVADAHSFVALIRPLQADVTYVGINGGGHDYQTWRRALPQALTWMTNEISGRPDRGSARAAPSAAATPPAMPGAGRPQGTGHPATAPHEGTGHRRTSSPSPAVSAGPARV